ncbi:MAG TPA: prepilin peptidase [Jatrophihabitans sp.]|nr:prepilin peptidase [Jatrophihabitans sp.]
MPVLIAATALLGLAIGSFLNVVIYRLPLGMSLSRPASACPSCGNPIRKRHNVPVLGWLLLRGRCADCSAPISARYPTIEALTAVLFVACAWRIAQLHLLPALPAYLIFAAIAVALSMIDVDVHRLPNGIVLPAYPVLGMALTLAAVILDQPGALLRAAICGMSLFLLYFILAFINPKGMGFGDVKLAGLIGGMLGFLSYQAFAVGACAAFLIGGCFGIFAMLAAGRSRKSALPFGPFMLSGAFLAVFLADPVWQWYSNFALAG